MCGSEIESVCEGVRECVWRGWVDVVASVEEAQRARKTFCRIYDSNSSFPKLFNYQLFNAFFFRKVSLAIKGVGSQGDGTVQVRSICLVCSSPV